MNFISAPRSANLDAFFLSFCVVAMAEIFDKTWFVALVLALRHDKRPVFWGSFLSLSLHVVIAAAFGWYMSRMVSMKVLHFGVAVLYAAFAVIYAYDWATSEGCDIIATGKEEVDESLQEDAHVNEEAAMTPGVAYGTLKSSRLRPRRSPKFSDVFLVAFAAVFIAEWGDRTQIAMIGVHASQPLLPVMLGSTAAFGLLSLSAVVMSTFLADQSLSETRVKAIVALSFAVFTAIAVYEGITSSTPQPQGPPQIPSKPTQR
eukprot:CAMPEP_0172689026 /NCGR_PEP_ID=MMETSP1074-20121228/22859_1 /TAXON_ID=2916 /ORGANISM="Ceratium fusus, Strain PA161109" /LENGTH=259 /DNA_ID=CAMNT_0013508773 /DNA_START=41 /DNA_END=820 /DNA_ORIENTATION=-